MYMSNMHPTCHGDAYLRGPRTYHEPISQSTSICQETSNPCASIRKSSTAVLPRLRISGFHQCCMAIWPDLVIATIPVYITCMYVDTHCLSIDNVPWKVHTTDGLTYCTECISLCLTIKPLGIPFFYYDHNSIRRSEKGV